MPPLASLHSHPAEYTTIGEPQHRPGTPTATLGASTSCLTRPRPLSSVFCAGPDDSIPARYPARSLRGALAPFVRGALNGNSGARGNCFLLLRRGSSGPLPRRPTRRFIIHRDAAEVSRPRLARLRGEWSLRRSSDLVDCSQSRGAAIFEISR